MKTLTACTALLAAVGLAACQPAAEGGDSADVGASSAEGAAVDVSATGGETVEAHVREGLWQVTASFPDGGGASMTTRICMDESMTALNTGAAQSTQVDACTQDVTRMPDGFGFTSRCEPEGGGVTETVGSLTGDFQTAYRMEATVTTTGSPMAAMNSTTRVVQQAEYQGACPEGWRPGDVEMPGLGMRININDAQAAAQAGG